MHGSNGTHEAQSRGETSNPIRWVPESRDNREGCNEEVRMGKFGLSKRCRCPRRAWTTGCPHTWHYAFQWKRRRYRGTLDDVLGRHIAGKTEALKEAEKIYDDVRDETPGKKAGRLTLRRLGDTY